MKFNFLGMCNKMNGAEALINSLIIEGVDTVFGYPGGQIISVYDKLYDYTDKINHILVRHEQGAIHAAQGYARCSGKTGVVIVTSGPGAANVVTGLADALMDSTPLVVISGQVSSEFLGTDAFQEVDAVAMTQEVTKWAIQIRRPEDIPSAVARAFYIASTGRPGPVVLDISKDAQVGMVDWEHDICSYIRSYNPSPEIDQNIVNQTASLINKAKHPLILAGHGVMISGAEDELRSVAEKAFIPVGTTLLGLSTFPTDHPLNMGMLGMHGSIAANMATASADVILAVGLRFDDRVTLDLKHYARNAKIIHINIDPYELNKNVTVDIPVASDAKAFLRELYPMLISRTESRMAKLKEKCYAVETEKIIEPEIHPSEGKLKMGEVVRVVSDMAPANSVCVTDVGQNQMFSARYYKFTRPRSFITSGGLGTMGYGLPASIGAKVSSPEREVILFVGDGGIQMTIEEFGTIMQYNVGVKIVLLNNNFLGNVRQWQEMFFNGRFSQTPMLNPDFNKLADAYGIKSRTVYDRNELKDAVAEMLECKEAFLLNVEVDETDMIFPMIPSGGRIDRILIDEKTFFTTDNL